MVFERVSRLAAGAGERAEEEIQGQVVCKLLAASGQVWSVLGVGGRVVEKIRQESGAHIQVVSSREQLIPFAGDDIIHITGNFLAVRKALLSVSSCLQDYPRTEPTGFSATSFGTNIRGVAPPAPGDPYAQRSYLPTPHAPDYHPRAYSSGMDLMTSGLRKFPEEEVMFRILCSSELIGSITGKAGAVIRALQSETGASIMVADSFSDSDEKIIVISARESADLKHSPAQEALLLVHFKLAEAGHDRGSVISVRLLVPMQQVGCLLVKGGAVIEDMKRASGANIQIFTKEQVPKFAQRNDELVQVTGTVQAVRDALIHITGRIRESIFRSKHYLSVGMNSYMSAASDAPLHRSRIDTAPPGRYYTTGLSHGLHPSGGLYDPINRQASFSHGVGSPNTYRAPFPYGAESPGLRPSFDHSSSPRSWTPQGLNSGNPKGTPEAGMGLNYRSGMMGSGSQTPIMTSTTIRVVVPQHLLGYVYGEDSNNLFEIREISGAKVSIFDPKGGATEGEVIISGSPDQTGMAQSLLHAFIFYGQESP